MDSIAPATPAGNIYSHPFKVKAKNIRGEARLPFYSSKVARAQYWAVRATGGRTGGEPAGQAMAHLLLHHLRAGNANRYCVHNPTHTAPNPCRHSRIGFPHQCLVARAEPIKPNHTHTCQHSPAFAPQLARCSAHVCALFQRVGYGGLVVAVHRMVVFAFHDVGLVGDAVDFCLV